MNVQNEEVDDWQVIENITEDFYMWQKIGLTCKKPIPLSKEGLIMIGKLQLWGEYWKKWVPSSKGVGPKGNINWKGEYCENWSCTYLQ
jgi:hypothetical protein